VANSLVQVNVKGDTIIEYDNGQSVASNIVTSSVFDIARKVGKEIAVFGVITTLFENTATSVHHIGAEVQISGDGTNWTTIQTHNGIAESAAVTAGTCFGFIANLKKVSGGKYMRIIYRAHTSGHTVLADVTAGAVKTMLSYDNK